VIGQVIYVPGRCSYSGSTTGNIKHGESACQHICNSIRTIRNIGKCEVDAASSAVKQIITTATRCRADGAVIGHLTPHLKCNRPRGRQVIYVPAGAVTGCCSTSDINVCKAAVAYAIVYKTIRNISKCKVYSAIGSTGSSILPTATRGRTDVAVNSDITRCTLKRSHCCDRQVIICSGSVRP